jgi:gamma-glutamyl:cysteine ligase YbdK (ATP-grasp superfamily)
MPFDRGNRTYYVSDERLRAFRALPTEEKLRWVEELATFLRMVQAGDDKPVTSVKNQNPSASA